MSKLEKIECETIVNWNKEEPFAVVYTRDKEVMKKVEISTKLRKRRWNTEVTSCDALYLEKIGLYQE